MVPDENCQAYEILFKLENTLRELIIDKLSRVLGEQWCKRGLPPDVFERYKAGMAYERNAKWNALIPHHPIYYVEFTDLKKTINRNFNQAFKEVFVREEQLESILSSELECVRNKCAHNRKITTSELEIARIALEKLRNFCTPGYFESLSNRCTFENEIGKQLLDLNEELEKSYKLIKEFEPIKNLDIWESIRDRWWFDDSYLSHSILEIKNYFEVALHYTKLSRARGQGYIIENWVKNNNLAAKYKAACSEFKPLAEGYRNGIRSNHISQSL